VNKSNAATHLKEALKKIEQCHKTKNEHGTRDCWFSLVQRCISVLASSISETQDLHSLKTLENKYVLKEIGERFLKNQLTSKISNQEVFCKCVEMLKEIKEGRSEEMLDFIQFYSKECFEKNEELKSNKKKSYIDWVV